MYKPLVIFIVVVSATTIECAYIGDFSHQDLGQHIQESFDHQSESFGHDLDLHQIQEHDFGGHEEHQNFGGHEEHHDFGGLEEQHNFGEHIGHNDFSEHHEEEKHEEPKDYNFNYSVHDPHHHGYHSHQESSHDGVVKGYYSIKEADGSLREVHYTADKKNGFKAIVTKNGVQVHPHTDGSSHSTGSFENLVHH